MFINQFHRDLADNVLTHEDWQMLKPTHEFLQPFYQVTLEQQMEWASIDQVLENMDILFMQFENAKVFSLDFPTNARGSIINNRVDKIFSQRSHGQFDSHGLVGALQVLQREWPKPNLCYRPSVTPRKAPAIYGSPLDKGVVRQRSRRSAHAAGEVQAPTACCRGELQPKQRRTRNDALPTHQTVNKRARYLPGDEDEFEKFITRSPRHISTNNPLEWWCRQEQRSEYPRLYQIAIDILSVPAISDDLERVFSCIRYAQYLRIELVFL